jgi:Na+/pantothenate symporter
LWQKIGIRDMSDTVMSPDPMESWHLDKRVNVSLIVVLAAQIAAGIWFASKMDSRLSAVEARTTMIESTRVGESLAELKTSQKNVEQAVRRIEAIIDAQRK